MRKAVWKTKLVSTALPVDSHKASLAAPMTPQNIARTVGIALLIFCAVLMASSGTYVVQPGYRGVEVTMGKVSPAFKPEGFGMKVPVVTLIHPVSIRQQTAEDKADCYSSDLQQIHVELRVLFRIPEASW